MNLVYEGPDASVPFGKLLRIGLPVAQICLPPVVHRDPAHSELLRFGQCIFNLLWLKLAPKTPRTPNWLKAACGWVLKTHAFGNHYAPVFAQRTEIVARVNVQERFQCLK